MSVLAKAFINLGEALSLLHQPSARRSKGDGLIFKFQFKAEEPMLKMHPGEAEFASRL